MWAVPPGTYYRTVYNFTIFINMIRLKTLITEYDTSGKSKHVVQANTKTLQYLNSKISEFIIVLFQSTLQSPASQYTKELNANAELISKYIKSGNSINAVQLYLKTFSDVYYKSLTSLGTVTKYAIRKLISKQDLEEQIKQYRWRIDEYYYHIFDGTFMNLTDVSSDTERKWLDASLDHLDDRKEKYIDQLIKSGIKTIYGS